MLRRKTGRGRPLRSGTLGGLRKRRDERRRGWLQVEGSCRWRWQGEGEAEGVSLKFVQTRRVFQFVQAPQLEDQEAESFAITTPLRRQAEEVRKPFEVFCLLLLFNEEVFVFEELELEGDREGPLPGRKNSGSHHSPSMKPSHSKSSQRRPEGYSPAGRKRSRSYHDQSRSPSPPPAKGAGPGGGVAAAEAGPRTVPIIANGLRVPRLRR